MSKNKLDLSKLMESTNNSTGINIDLEGIVADIKAKNDKKGLLSFSNETDADISINHDLRVFPNEEVVRDAIKLRIDTNKVTDTIVESGVEITLLSKSKKTRKKLSRKDRFLMKKEPTRGLLKEEQFAFFQLKILPFMELDEDEVYFPLPHSALTDNEKKYFSNMSVLWSRGGPFDMEISRKAGLTLYYCKLDKFNQFMKDHSVKGV